MSAIDQPQMSPRKFLGRGFRYPFGFSGRTGGVYQGNVVSQSEAEQHIAEAILQILGTRIGSRVMRRDWGSQIRSIVFDPNDPSFDPEIDFIIRNAIETWEPRVIVGPIRIDRTYWKDGYLQVKVTFTIIKTNVTGNLVFPYYLSPEERQAYADQTNANTAFGV